MKDRDMNPTIRIMMATYNGEKYLREQVESILNQTYQNWCLIVQDDGSKDKTWEILEEYCKNDSRISIRKSPESKHGAYYNFHSIANQEKESGIFYDLYMFSDQDDIWDIDKIEKMVRWFEKYKSGNPLFLYGDMRVVDNNKNIISQSICDSQCLHYVNKYSLFFSHIIYGCNVMMNREAFMSVPIINISESYVSILSHDNLYAKFSGISGNVEFLNEALMSYRRHGENATAKQQYGFGIGRIVKRIIGIQDLARDHARTYSQSLIAIDLLKKSTNYDQTELDELQEALENGGFLGISYINEKRISWGNKVKDASHKLIILTGIYKKYLNKNNYG